MNSVSARRASSFAERSTAPSACSSKTSCTRSQSGPWKSAAPRPPPSRRRARSPSTSARTSRASRHSSRCGGKQRVRPLVERRDLDHVEPAVAASRSVGRDHPSPYSRRELPPRISSPARSASDRDSSPRRDQLAERDAQRLPGADGADRDVLEHAGGVAGGVDARDRRDREGLAPALHQAGVADRRDARGDVDVDVVVDRRHHRRVADVRPRGVQEDHLDAVCGTRLERPAERERRAEAQVDVAVAVAGVQLQGHAAAPAHVERAEHQQVVRAASPTGAPPPRPGRPPRRGRTRRGPRPCRPATTPSPERYAMIDFSPAAPASRPASQAASTRSSQSSSEVASASSRCASTSIRTSHATGTCFASSVCGTTTSGGG